jgi:ABC-2 type transport system ATP-binding protein
MGEVILEARGLTKSYGTVKALDRFTVTLEENKIYGLLGRNGAGKTTFLNIITSHIFADEGEVRLFGRDVAENQDILPKICYMPEKNLFIKNMRVSRILKTAGIFYDGFDMDYALKLCGRFALDMGKKYKELSRGYESILGIVIGLASRAPVTIFDEPVLGLDAAVRDIFYRELLEDYIKNPRTYIISTHLIEESADVFEEALIIKDGVLIQSLTVGELKESARYVSGKAGVVDQAVSGMKVLHSELIGNVKVCMVFDSSMEERLKGLSAFDVDISPVPVQKLFIYLTEGQEVRS